MEPSILSLIPPCLTIIFAIATHAILPSLMLGVISASLILNKEHFQQTIPFVIEKLRIVLGITDQLSLTTLYNSFAFMMFLFLLCLGCLITLITHAGGAYAYARPRENQKISEKSAGLKTVLLAVLLCIDDYFSTLTVGSVMKSITDHAKMPRIKLAFIITSLSTTLCAIIPFSSWGAEIIGQLTIVGVNTSQKSFLAIEPMHAFFLVIPLVLQAWSTLANLLTYIFIPVYFGPFFRQQVIAHETNNLWGGQEPLQSTIASVPERNKASASRIDFFLPLATLVLILIAGLLYTGNSLLFGGTATFFETLKQANSAQALGITGISTLCITTLFFLLRKKVFVPELPVLYKEGCSLMFSTVLMLTAAWTLTQIVKNDLQTGAYLASIFPQTIPPLFLPAAAYLMGIGMTLGIGSAWASIGLLLSILLPLSAQLLHLSSPITPESASLIFVIIGAIISGSLQGNQISPIADVTVMASNCSGAYHSDFMSAQWWYSVPQIFTLTIAYLLLGGLSLYTTHLSHWIIGYIGILFYITLSPRGYIALQNRRYKP